jgi:hypothetical protein
MNREQVLTREDLCSPVYLDQGMVFDMLAFIEDGLYDVATVKTSVSDADAQKKSVSASLGVENIFSFLKIGIKGDGSSEQSIGTHEERERDLIFTPSSLFARLRQRLRERDLIVDMSKVASLDGLQSGMLVEFQAVIQENPVLEALRVAVEYDTFVRGGKARATRSSQRNKNPQRSDAGTASDAGIPDHMLQILETLRTSDEPDLVCNLREGPVSRAILTTGLPFFNNQNVRSVVDGEYRILGPIVRISDATESMSLLRGTPVAKAPEDYLTLFRDWVQGIVQSTGLKVPERLDTEIQGPAIRVRPMAIYS